MLGIVIRPDEEPRDPRPLHIRHQVARYRRRFEAPVLPRLAIKFECLDLLTFRLLPTLDLLQGLGPPLPGDADAQPVTGPSLLTRVIVRLERLADFFCPNCPRPNRLRLPGAPPRTVRRNPTQRLLVRDLLP
jgi:hypothetical protein